MGEPAAAAPASQTFACENCGGQVQFDAGSRRLKCGHCGTEQDVPAEAGAAAVQEHDLANFSLDRVPRGLGVATQNIECKDCGADVSVGEGMSTAKCPFCGSAHVLAQAEDTQTLRPESLVPFAVAAEAAREKFTAWLKKLWFRPSDLRKLATVSELRGVYVPFWTYDTNVESSWTAQRGHYYYVTEGYTAYVNGKAVHRTRQVRKVRWEHASGHRRDFFDDLLVCASKGLPADLVDRFKTFDTKALTPYQPQFLSGWTAERYAIDLKAGWETAKQRAGQTQFTRCGGDVGGDTHRFLSVRNQFNDVTFKHVLLPIWIAAYHYKQKLFRFLVNGQTGEVVGKAPWSVLKITLLVLTILALIGGGIAIYQYNQQPPAAMYPGYAPAGYMPGATAYPMAPPMYPMTVPTYPMTAQ